MYLPEAIIDEFLAICQRMHMDYNLYESLFAASDRNLELFVATAPMLFEDLNRILIDHVLIQFGKITDPAKSGKKKTNLTTNYILEEISWPPDIHGRLVEINGRLMDFRGQIEAARSKRLAHIDLTAQLEQQGPLGDFPPGHEKHFLNDLQEFMDIAFGHFHDSEPCSISPSASTYTHGLIQALEKSRIFDVCGKCSPSERRLAAREYRNR